MPTTRCSRRRPAHRAGCRCCDCHAGHIRCCCDMPVHSVTAPAQATPSSTPVCPCMTRVRRCLRSFFMPSRKPGRRRGYPGSFPTPSATPGDRSRLSLRSAGKAERRGRRIIAGLRGSPPARRRREGVVAPAQARDPGVSAGHDRLGPRLREDDRTLVTPPQAGIHGMFTSPSGLLVPRSGAGPAACARHGGASSWPLPSRAPPCTGTASTPPA